MPLTKFLKENGLLDAVVVREDWKWDGNRIRCSSCWKQNEYGFHSQQAHDNHIAFGKPLVQIESGKKTCTACHEKRLQKRLQKRRVKPEPHTE